MRHETQLLTSITVLAACSLLLLWPKASVPPVQASDAVPFAEIQAEAEAASPSPFAEATALAFAPPQIPARPGHMAIAPRTGPEPAPDPTPLAATGDDNEADGAVDGTAWIAAAGTSRDTVDTGGRTVRWSLEVEAATGLDVDAVLATAEAALYDRRSWASDYVMTRVAPGEARIRVLIATPSTVDRLCAQAGLNTVGRLSCWTGSVAAINLDRWNLGTTEITDLEVYRGYVINHEVGHGLGHGHVSCAGQGQLAHVMQQQTISLDGCRANAWRYPNA